MQELLHISEEAKKTLIEKAKAAGWEIRSWGRGNSRFRPLPSSTALGCSPLHLHRAQDALPRMPADKPGGG
jgi:hypothetical protein